MLDHAITKRLVVLYLESILVFIAVVCLYPFLSRDQRLWAGIRRVFEESAAELGALKRAGNAKQGKGSRGDSKPSEPARSVLLHEQKAGYQDREENQAMNMLNK